MCEDMTTKRRKRRAEIQGSPSPSDIPVYAACTEYICNKGEELHDR
jgi:hypothetical protein